MDPVKAAEDFRQKYCYRGIRCLPEGDRLEKARKEFAGFSAKLQYLILRDLERTGSGLAAALIGSSFKSSAFDYPTIRSVDKILKNLRSVVTNPLLTLWEKRRAVRLGLIILKELHSGIESENLKLDVPVRRKIRDALIEIYRISRRGKTGSPVFDTDDDLIFDSKDKVPIPYIELETMSNIHKIKEEVAKNKEKFASLIEDDRRWKAFLKGLPEGGSWYSYGSSRSWRLGYKKYQVFKKKGRIVIFFRIFLNPETRYLEGGLTRFEPKLKRRIEREFKKLMPEQGVQIKILFVKNPFSADAIIDLGYPPRGRHDHWHISWDTSTYAHEIVHFLDWPDRYHGFQVCGDDQTFRPGMQFLVAQDELMNNHYLPRRLIRKHDVRFTIASTFNWVGNYNKTCDMYNDGFYEEAVNSWWNGKKFAKIIGIGNPEDHGWCYRNTEKKLKNVRPLLKEARTVYYKFFHLKIAIEEKKRVGEDALKEKEQLAKKLISICQKILEIYPRSRAARFYLMKADPSNGIKHFLLLVEALYGRRHPIDYRALAERNRRSDLNACILKYLNPRMSSRLMVKSVHLKEPGGFWLGGSFWVRTEMKIYDRKLKKEWTNTIILTAREIATIFTHHYERNPYSPMVLGEKKWGPYNIARLIEERLLSNKP